MSLRLIARPDTNHLPSLPLPFYVRSIGSNDALPGFEEKIPGRPFVELFWIVSGCAEFTLPNGHVESVSAEESIFYLPLEPHHIRNASENGTRMKYHWITFDGPGAETFLMSYGYPRGKMVSGTCPVHLFREIERHITIMTPYSQRKMISLLTDILALAGAPDDNSGREAKIVQSILELIRTRYADPALNINAVSDSLQLHRSTITRIFKRKMTLSPIEYLMNFRIQRALSLLQDTTLGIAEIARMTGFSGQSYFTRLIHRHTGMSPSAFRLKGVFRT